MKQEYNEEPVSYCRNCLSLKIKKVGNLELYACQECGNVDIEMDTITDWDKKYVQKYGKSFLDGEH